MENEKLTQTKTSKPPAEIAMFPGKTPETDLFMYRLDLLLKMLGDEDASVTMHVEKNKLIISTYTDNDKIVCSLKIGIRSQSTFVIQLHARQLRDALQIYQDSPVIIGYYNRVTPVAFYSAHLSSEAVPVGTN